MNKKKNGFSSLHPSALIPHPLVTLLTDFGTADYFVGAMKGAILSVNPEAQIIDITHEIPPQDIHAGAFTLLACYRDFPAHTIHVAVVDPGVGSTRRPILVVASDQFFIGPDNGLFSYILTREANGRIFHLTNEKYFRQPVSATFHGRDVFAPVAGALSAGVKPDELGEETTDFVQLASLAPQQLPEGSLAATIIHIDHFGNCITNITREYLPEELPAHGLRLLINNHEVTSFHRFYAEEGTATGELFAIWGSAGFLEIVAFQASAAQSLNAQRGQAIIFDF